MRRLSTRVKRSTLKHFSLPGEKKNSTDEAREREQQLEEDTGEEEQSDCASVGKERTSEKEDGTVKIGSAFKHMVDGARMFREKMTRDDSMASVSTNFSLNQGSDDNLNPESDLENDLEERNTERESKTSVLTLVARSIIVQRALILGCILLLFGAYVAPALTYSILWYTLVVIGLVAFYLYLPRLTGMLFSFLVTKFALFGYPLSCDTLSVVPWIANGKLNVRVCGHKFGFANPIGFPHKWFIYCGRVELVLQVPLNKIPGIFLNRRTKIPLKRQPDFECLAIIDVPFIDFDELSLNFELSNGKFNINELTRELAEREVHAYLSWQQKKKYLGQVRRSPMKYIRRYCCQLFTLLYEEGVKLKNGKSVLYLVLKRLCTNGDTRRDMACEINNPSLCTRKSSGDGDHLPGVNENPVFPSAEDSSGTEANELESSSRSRASSIWSTSSAPVVSRKKRKSLLGIFSANSQSTDLSLERKGSLNLPFAPGPVELTAISSDGVSTLGVGKPSHSNTSPKSKSSKSPRRKSAISLNLFSGRSSSRGARSDSEESVAKSFSHGNIRMPNKLEVTIVRARGLRVGDRKFFPGAKMVDPKVTVKLRDQSGVTATRYNTNKPMYNQTFDFHCSDPSTVLHVIVTDEELTNAETLGQWIMTLKHLELDPSYCWHNTDSFEVIRDDEDVTIKGWFPLMCRKWTGCEERECGEIEMEIRWYYNPALPQHYEVPSRSALASLDANSKETHLRLGNKDKVIDRLSRIPVLFNIRRVIFHRVHFFLQDLFRGTKGHAERLRNAGKSSDDAKKVVIPILNFSSAFRPRKGEPGITVYNVLKSFFMRGLLPKVLDQSILGSALSQTMHGFAHNFAHSAHAFFRGEHDLTKIFTQHRRIRHGIRSYAAHVKNKFQSGKEMSRVDAEDEEYLLDATHQGYLLKASFPPQMDAGCAIRSKAVFKSCFFEVKGNSVYYKPSQSSHTRKVETKEVKKLVLDRESLSLVLCRMSKTTVLRVSTEIEAPDSSQRNTTLLALESWFEALKRTGMESEVHT